MVVAQTGTPGCGHARIGVVQWGCLVHCMESRSILVERHANVGPCNGQVFFQWVMPDGRFELSWRATLSPMRSGMPNSTSRPAATVARAQHAMGAHVRQHPRFTGWFWNWSWERVPLDNDHP